MEEDSEWGEVLEWVEVSGGAMQHGHISAVVEEVYPDADTFSPIRRICRRLTHITHPP